MRDRTAARNYSPAGEEFRREHQRHRAWGLTRRHADRLRRARGGNSPTPAAGETSPALVSPTSTPSNHAVGPAADPDIAARHHRSGGAKTTADQQGSPAKQLPRPASTIPSRDGLSRVAGDRPQAKSTADRTGKAARSAANALTAPSGGGLSRVAGDRPGSQAKTTADRTGKATWSAANALTAPSGRGLSRLVRNAPSRSGEMHRHPNAHRHAPVQAPYRRFKPRDSAFQESGPAAHHPSGTGPKRGGADRGP
ncbi:hypothetical protein DFJ67_4518 [Asanoa ferruginea]|uniref:Uncharacterized protein n=1 Tax=Asanoa ferruginea TaxID=53367 RepID=A0A3D9ZXG8_9ACTN|nr:hypothetical protein DFJ67_4518 [Asanoa ferruginea]